MAERLRQAGGIVFAAAGNGDVRVLIVTSTRRPSVWLFPKGDIERGETAGRAARRETSEEAGVKTEVVQSVGRLKYRDGPFEVDLELFLLRCKDKSAESPEKRRRRWVSLEQAGRLHYLGPRLAPVLRVVKAALKKAAAP